MTEIPYLEMTKISKVQFLKIDQEEAFRKFSEKKLIMRAHIAP
jgi:hypothetical protein